MNSGYRLAYVQAMDRVVAVAGFRIRENLAWGRFLYVDDLVTLPAHRSKGCGAKLLSWLLDLAAKEGCQEMHLDSGIQRADAHRFYERAGMTMASFHFVKNVNPIGQGQVSKQPSSPFHPACVSAPRRSIKRVKRDLQFSHRYESLLRPTAQLAAKQ